MRRLRLVVADDHGLMVEAVRIALEGRPEFEVVGVAESGSQVLPVVQQTKPDLVLLDLRMPGMDGIEVCRHLKRDPVTAGIPVIILTGVDDHDIQTDALIAGAAALLTKPCSPPKLLGTIRAAVDRSLTPLRLK